MTDNDELLLISIRLTDDYLGSGTEFEAMSELEKALGAALQAAGVGYCDGNEIGGGRRAMYFYGPSAAEMWEVLKPIMTRSSYRFGALVELHMATGLKTQLLG